MTAETSSVTSAVLDDKKVFYNRFLLIVAGLGGLGSVVAIALARVGVGRLILVDEVLTPDSSRFWPSESYRPGGPQPSFDKQFLRDYLETLDWNKKAPAPFLPEDIIRKTAEKYREALEKLTDN